MQKFKKRKELKWSSFKAGKLSISSDLGNVYKGEVETKDEGGKLDCKGAKVQRRPKGRELREGGRCGVDT